MFLRHTAVYWTKWSSSRPPCGLGLESPNLFVASSTWRHEATSGFIPLLQLQGYITVAVCMIMIVKIFPLDSNMITRVSDASPCIYFYTSIYVSTLLVVLPSETCPILHLEQSPSGYYRPSRVRLYSVVAAVSGYRTCGTGEAGEHHREGARGLLLVLDVHGVHRAYRNGNGIGTGSRVP